MAVPAHALGTDRPTNAMGNAIVSAPMLAVPRPGSARWEENPRVDRLDLLFALSKREIEAHVTELGDTETGRYFVDEAHSCSPHCGNGRRASTARISRFEMSWTPLTSPRFGSWPTSFD